MSKRPSLAYETACWAQGHRCVAGIDEAGRGALAGPVVAAAVALPPETALDAADLPWSQVRDSKQLSPARRGTLFDAVQQHALAWAIGCVDAVTIDQIGIAAATRRAMQQAVAALAPAADALVIDWVKLPSVNLPQAKLYQGRPARCLRGRGFDFGQGAPRSAAGGAWCAISSLRLFPAQRLRHGPAPRRHRHPRPLPSPSPHLCTHCPAPHALCVHLIRQRDFEKLGEVNAETRRQKVSLYYQR